MINSVLKHYVQDDEYVVLDKLIELVLYCHSFNGKKEVNIKKEFLSYITPYSKDRIDYILNSLANRGFIFLEENQKRSCLLVKFTPKGVKTLKSCGVSFLGEDLSVFDIEQISEKQREELVLDKDRKNDRDNEFVNEMYVLYPAFCPLRQASTCKSNKAKGLIKKLIKMYTYDQIRKVFVYAASQCGVTYLKNLDTFCNNFPDPSTIEDVVVNVEQKNNQEDKATYQNKEITIGGVVYK